MAYVALYRAYRPQKFSEVVGQQHIIKTLQNAIKLNKVAHAYLFCGPRGTGKTTLAKIMAKAMNCEHGPIVEPCCECEVCQGIAKGIVSDVVEIDAASNNGADDIRALRETVKFLPSVGKYKVYIIDEVHMLSNAAFNALLKTLEEPPHHVIFILATTEPYKLPTTILSRCQRFDFQGISLDDIIRRLRIVADEESIKITDDAINQIALSAEGGMRDALSLFDQCISYSVNPEITLDDVLAVSGNISYLKLIELLKYCNEANSPSSISLINDLIANGKEVPRIVNDLIIFLRDLLMYKNDAVLERKPMYELPEFKELAKSLYKSLIFSWLDILNNSLTQMRFSTQKRAYLELAILKMSDNRQNEETKLIERVEVLENLVHKLSSVNVPPRIKNNEFKPEFSSSDDLMRLRNQNSSIPTTPTKPIEQVDVYQNVPVQPVQPEPVYQEPAEVVQNEPQYENMGDDYQDEMVAEPITSSAPIVEQNDLAKPLEVTPEPKLEIPSDEISIKDIEPILNSASKDKKIMLNSLWVRLQTGEKYQNLYNIQMLVRGKVLAVSDDAFIVELADAGFCNRIMKYENYVKIIEILSELGMSFKDYICIPKDVWAKIALDYKSKYNPTNPGYVHLDEIRTSVKKRIMPEVIQKSPEEALIEDTKEFFDDLEVEEN